MTFPRRWSFGLRTLFIAMTVCAVLAGGMAYLVAYMMRDVDLITHNGKIVWQRTIPRHP